MVQAPEIAQEKLRIKLKAYDHRLLQQAVDMVLEAARTTGARVGGAASLPTKCAPPAFAVHSTGACATPGCT